MQRSLRINTTTVLDDMKKNNGFAVSSSLDSDTSEPTKMLNHLILYSYPI